MEQNADTMLDELFASEQEWQKPFREGFERWCARAEQVWPSFSRPRLAFTTNGGAAGKAYYAQNEIRLNPTYCQTNREDMLKDTLPHEIAHFLAYQRYKDHAHGGSWYAMYGALTGRAPTRCHDYESISQAKAKLYGGSK